MAPITPYLFFDGNCRDAMNFYKDCLGGELHMQTVAETPAAEHVPPEARQKIMHAKLTSGELELMGSDWMSETAFSRSNSISLAIRCTSDDQIKTLFASLSEGGEVVHPLAEQFWGATFGQLVDRFGTEWMLNLT